MAREWLLPGVGQLVADTVYPFESNPLFIESFLLGLNTQTLGELRWRNMAIATGCTPLKMFWGRTDASGTQRVNDIRDIGNWSAASDLGDSQHQPDGADRENLVFVFRSELFRRYPRTVVSSVKAKITGVNPDWEHLPDAAEPRVWPLFQGTVGDDITFFGFPMTAEEARLYWFVLEEPPTGYRFLNDADANQDKGLLPMPTADDGGSFAAQRIHQPTRVFIKGGQIIPE